MKLQRILETCIYAQDLEAAEVFYSDVLGLDLYLREVGRHLFFKLDSSMLLIFNPDRTMELGTDIPPHGAYGQGHIAFAIRQDELGPWQNRLTEKGVPIEAEVAWPNGGISIYFRDPAGNSLEFTTPDTWQYAE